MQEGWNVLNLLQNLWVVAYFDELDKLFKYGLNSA